MINAQTIDRIGWTLIHSVWQMMLIACLGGLFCRLLFRRSATFREGSRGPWLGGIMLLMVLVCFAMLFWQRDDAMAHAAELPRLDSSGWKAKATIKLDDRIYLLGENVHLKFGITNTQDELVEIEVGGDYRGGPRPLRFKVLAYDAQGRRVEDP